MEDGDPDKDNLKEEASKEAILDLHTEESNPIKQDDAPKTEFKEMNLFLGQNVKTGDCQAKASQREEDSLTSDMWRFKTSKYKNATPNAQKAKQVIPSGIIAPASNPLIAASAALVAFNLEPKGTIALLPHEEATLSQDDLISAHSDDVLSLAFSPFHDDLLASCSRNEQVKLWHWPNTQNPLLSWNIPAEKLAFHPTCDAFLSTAASSTISLWDVTQAQKTVLNYEIKSPNNSVNSLSWRADGALLGVCGENGLVWLGDPRNSEPLYEGCLAPKLNDLSLLWLGAPDSTYFLLSGVSKTKQTQVLFYDIRNLDSPLTDLSGPTAFSSPMLVFDPDTDMLFMATKGEPSLNFYEVSYKDTSFIQGATFQCDHSIRALALLPKRALSLMEAEVNRVLVLTNLGVCPVSYLVPRKSYRTFHSDLYPDTPGTKPALLIEEWLAGENKLVETVTLDPDLKCISITEGQLFQEKKIEIAQENGLNLPSEHDTEILDKTEGEDLDENHYLEGEADNAPEKPPEPVLPSLTCSETTEGEEDKSPSENIDATQVTACASTSLTTELPPTKERGPQAEERPSSFKMQSSKCKHITGKPDHKSSHITHIKNVSSNVGSGESTGFAANAQRAAFQLNIPGGHLAVLELNPGRRLSDPPYPSFLCGTTLTDFAWDPFDDYRLIAGCDNGELLICVVPREGELKPDTAPRSRFRGTQSRVTIISFHPTASNVAAVAYVDRSLVVWDLSTYRPQLVLDPCHPEQIWSLAWNPDGTHLATLARDHQIRMFNPRQDSGPIAKWKVPHLGGRGGKLCWVLNGTHLALAGFSRFSERQVLIVDSRKAESEPCATIGLDVNLSILIPHYDEDTRTLFLTGKGDTTIYTLEVTTEGDGASVGISPLTPHSCATPHLATCFLPKNSVDVVQVEVARAVCLTTVSLEPLAFTVPRQRANYFQDDLFPPTRITWQPQVSSAQWFSGEDGSPSYLILHPEGMEPVSQAKPLLPTPKAPEPELVLEKRFESSLPDPAIEKREQLFHAMLDKFEYLPLDSKNEEDPNEEVAKDEWED